MNIAFYTIDLFEGRQHLMPWRTVLEIGQRLLLRGHRVVILNGSTICQSDLTFNQLQIKNIRLGYDSLVKEARREGIDILFIQITWRDALKKMSALKQINAKKIAYFSGGVYDFYSAAYLMKNWGVKAAKPYLLESLTPKSLLISKLKSLDFKAIIGLTPLTASRCKMKGFEESTCILTGKDGFNEITPDNSLLTKYGLIGKKWMLFSGAPSYTRGACELLQAIDKTSEKGLRVVLLMRTDVGSDYEYFNNTYKRMKQKEKILVIRENATRPQLRAFFASAYYVLLPFLVIPSEIPVTYLEVMSCGTPIISFNNGGTTNYLNDGLLISNKRISSLSRKLEEAWRNDLIRIKKSEAAFRILSLHPSWDEVALKWEHLL